LEETMQNSAGRPAFMPPVRAHSCPFLSHLSAAVSVVLSHRLMSRQLAGKQPILPLREMLYETAERDMPKPAMDQVGMASKN
jgi:hypothetical protein